MYCLRKGVVAYPVCMHCIQYRVSYIYICKTLCYYTLTLRTLIYIAYIYAFADTFGEWITGMCDRCEMSLHNDIPRPYRITASFVYSRENNQAYNFCENCQLPQTRESET